VLRHPDYTRERIRQVVERIGARVHAERLAVADLEVSERAGRVPRADARALAYRPARRGEQFGPAFATFWFRGRAEVPAGWEGARVDLIWVTGSESTLWLDGRPAQGLNTGPRGDRPDAVLAEPAHAGETLRFEIELACNGTFGALPAVHETVEPVVLDRCDIARFDAQAWELFHDARVLAELEADAPNGLDPSLAGHLLAELNHVCNIWREDDRSTWEAAREALRPLLALRNGTWSHEISAIGHGHIDTIWLWPQEETRRKCVRTFSSALAYMRRYPEYRFACSQAQQYAWMRDGHPGLYEEIRERARAGQWVPVGGTWVEPDCNLPGGESLVRQFLVGQRFFERELGRRCREFWNPDVFGYCSQLPQIMRGAGIGRFLTQKLSWNRFNRPRHHTFTWRGLDGSEVLAHFPPADTYNAVADVAEVRRSARDYHDHDRSHESILVYGHGDGGGGPTPTMLETLRRVGDLQGMPRVAQRSAEEFFTRLERDCTDRPTLVGELYFELHRGTYTTQAKTKRGNRRCEELLRDVELLATAAARAGRAPYPRAELLALWETVLLNQFHDVLPGSSIGEVHRRAEADHAVVLREAERLLGAAAAALLAGGGETLVETLGTPFAGVVEAPGGALGWYRAEPFGEAARAAPADAVEVEAGGDGWTLRNGALEAVVGRDGSIRSLVHRASGREALSGPANALELYDDRPNEFDAWDVDPFHLETRSPCPPAHEAELARADPLRAEVVVRRRIGDASAAEQRIRLDAGSRRLEVHCDVEWHEDHRLLKAAFPLAVWTDEAVYETQFGAVARPTHYTTPYDLARYEVCAHRFAAMEEPGFGVALVNESKYGHSAHDGTLRLSLLRAPRAPDPDADRGRHRFAYALVPYAGSWMQAGIAREARRFNVPLRRVPGDGLGAPLLACHGADVVIEAVKLAEESDAAVVRLYEPHGARGTAHLRLGPALGPIRSAQRANLLEDPLDELAVADGAVAVDVRPWEIVTLVLR
jgi:alpha-mannosidase